MLTEFHSATDFIPKAQSANHSNRHRTAQKKTYGTIRLTVNLGLRRSYTWNIVIADTNTLIIGSDFLHPYNLLVNIKEAKLVAKTRLTCCGIHTHKNSSIIKTFNTSDAFAKLFEESHIVHRQCPASPT